MKTVTENYVYRKRTSRIRIIAIYRDIKQCSELSQYQLDAR